MKVEKTEREPLISIIIPVYNVELYLERCLNSVITQTYTNLEIILVNDASTDTSGRICDLYAARDGRVQVVHLTENQGVSHARNVGVGKAAGDLIGFVDADDYIETRMYECLYQTLAENQADVSVCGIDRIGFGKYAKREQSGSACVVSGSQAIRDIMHGLWGDYAVYNKLFHSSVVKKYRFAEHVYRGEDLLFLYIILRHSQCVSYTPAQLYHYIYRENSAMHEEFQISQYTQFRGYELLYQDMSKYYPDLLPKIGCQILDVNIRLAVSAVESRRVKRRTKYHYLQRFHTNIRKYINAEAMSLIVYRKIAAEILLLNFSTELFWMITVFYKIIKGILKSAGRGLKKVRGYLR